MVKEVKQVKYSDSFLSESAIFSGGVRGKMIPIIFAFFLIQTENRVILVDVGCDTMPGFQMNGYLMPDEALKKHGVLPEQVTDVIITHADHDHIDGLHHFKNAVVYIQEKEYERGKKYFTGNNKVITFEDEIMVDNCIKVVRFAGHGPGSSVVEFEFDSKSCVIVGDECYSKYNIINKVPTAATCNIDNSQKFIDKYATGQYKVFYMHE